MCTYAAHSYNATLVSHVVRDCLRSSTLHELNLTFPSLFKKECVRVRPAFSYALVAAAQMRA